MVNCSATLIKEKSFLPVWLSQWYIYILGMLSNGRLCCFSRWGVYIKAHAWKMRVYPGCTALYSCYLVQRKESSKIGPLWLALLQLLVSRLRWTVYVWAEYEAIYSSCSMEENENRMCPKYWFLKMDHPWFSGLSSHWSMFSLLFKTCKQLLHCLNRKSDEKFQVILSHLKMRCCSFYNIFYHILDPFSVVCRRRPNRWHRPRSCFPAWPVGGSCAWTCAVLPVGTPRRGWFWWWRMIGTQSFWLNLLKSWLEEWWIVYQTYLQYWTYWSCLKRRPNI